MFFFHDCPLLLEAAAFKRVSLGFYDELIILCFAYSESTFTIEEFWLVGFGVLNVHSVYRPAVPSTSPSRAVQ